MVVSFSLYFVFPEVSTINIYVQPEKITISMVTLSINTCYKLGLEDGWLRSTGPRGGGQLPPSLSCSSSPPASGRSGRRAPATPADVMRIPGQGQLLGLQSKRAQPPSLFFQQTSWRLIFSDTPECGSHSTLRAWLNRNQSQEIGYDLFITSKVLKGNSPAEAPQNKPKSTVRVQADGHFSRGVELTL